MLLIALLDVAACRDDSRTVIARNDEWAVTAVGSLDKRDIRNTFEVTRRGQPYAHNAYLHWDSDSFNEEYPVREWIAPNALRISRDRLDKPAHYIEVRNEGSSPIKWLRVGAFEFFLLFDLPPGDSVRLPCAKWHGGYGFSAQGEFQDGRLIARTPTAQGDEPARQVTFVIRDSGASVSIAPQP